MSSVLPPSASASPATFVTHLLDSLTSDVNAAVPPLPIGSLHPASASVGRTSTSTVTSSSPSPSSPSNPLLSADEALRKRLLTLHVLFPNEVLPALELLDRGLVTRLVVSGDEVRAEAGHVGKAGGARDESGGDIEGRGGIDEGPHAGTQSTQKQEKGDGTVGGEYAADAGVPRPTNADACGPSAQESSERSFARHAHPANLVIADDTSAPLRPSRPTADETAETAFYLVRSAQLVHTRSSRYASTSTAAASAAPAHKTYQVRLPAWNCTCPAFAFSAFPSSFADSDGGEELWEEHVDVKHFFPTAAAATVGRGAGREGDEAGEEEEGEEGEGKWIFGGGMAGAVNQSARMRMPPVCKHLLACVLGERCSLFAGFVQERRVGDEEVVGWSAGWGD
ncbi:uncharacterized protein EI97DRAFT_430148 [Westerdykella ornata]|uniref:SWIM-type domain-containing protein n=1 Tax=Westerdykella ornata TaxID=318751 RepID=A0A6A6JUX4_WESOR|nr:uncharacterized protein EI97DRAFT_430148 [Westerdykella ornata]KAF2280421.1 hypothetical protein EI97DRAFT_430148 [Westerdykella ornata]